jgi:hypothetical protein
MSKYDVTEMQYPLSKEEAERRGIKGNRLVVAAMPVISKTDPCWEEPTQHVKRDWR